MSEFCCEAAWREAKQLAWKQRDLNCGCDHNESCLKCWPLEFRAGGKWDKYVPVKSEPAAPDLKRIAWLIGTIFHHGEFVAETCNERELESVLKRAGYWFNSTDEAVAAEYAAPAQPAPTFPNGTLVRKRSGAQWQGRIVGRYSTALTPDGYAVESDTHAGSVQIYPAAALEVVA